MQLCRSYCYVNCEIWVESVSLGLNWKVLIWYMPIAPNAKYADYVVAINYHRMYVRYNLEIQQ